MKGYHDSKTPESIRDLWRTPKALFDYYDKRFDFTTDVAASIENNLCRKCYTSEYSALEYDRRWGNYNWCNPPYSDVMPWIKKHWNKKAKAVLPLCFSLLTRQ